jgi:hypothetical protein
MDRLEYAAAQGILGAHVGHPFFMPMTPESYRRDSRRVRQPAMDYWQGHDNGVAVPGCCEPHSPAIPVSSR